MNAGIEKEINAGASAPEGVMEGTPEITEDNLFDLVDSGAITLDEANEWIKAQEEAGEGAAVEAESVVNSTAEKEVNAVPENNEPVMGGVVPDVKPFKVYNTQEEFQRDFDRSWAKRYGKQKEEAEKKDAEYSALLTDLGDLLGVEPEQAAAELKRRKMTKAAQREGRNPDEYIETENLRAENARLKESEERRQAQTIVDEINAQGAAISKVDPAFDIDAAMRNPEFARQVFFTRQTNPERAVEIAYKIYYGDKAVATLQTVPAPASAVARPAEGAASAATTGARKPVDFSKMSSKDILAMEKEIMNGKKIEL